MLNKDEKYKGKVLSIDYGYYNKGRDNDARNSSYINLDLFKDYVDTEDDAILFKLDAKNSPFNERYINMFSNDYTDFKEKPMTNYFQYMLLIKNSKESKRIN